MSEYFEKLKDPRWQKVRLKVFERDGWECLACGDTQSTLNVHHLIYTVADPWDEPLENLETLCADCHEMREDFNRIAGDRGPTSTLAIRLFFYLCESATEEYLKTKRRLSDEQFAKAFSQYVSSEIAKKEAIQNGMDEARRQPASEQPKETNEHG